MRGASLRRTARRSALAAAVVAMVAAVVSAPAGPAGDRTDTAGAPPQAASPQARDQQPARPRDPGSTGDDVRATDRDPTRTDTPAARAAQEQQPSRDGERVSTGLEVTIEDVSPSTLGPGQPVQISGTVTNLDPKRWVDLQASLVIDPSAPITTGEQLDEVLESPSDAYSGERILSPGLYDDLTDLDPGESTDYSLSVPFGRLGLEGAASGAYTVSVHVLGQRVDQAREDGADGRARTLMPYLGDDDRTVGVSAVIPLRHPLVRGPDGAYADVDELVESVSYGGLLRNRLDLVSAADAGRPTLLVDPALLDALRTLAAGGDGTPPAGEPDGGQGGEGEQAGEAQAAATEFLDRLRLAASRSRVLVEPYGRADLTALAGDPGRRLLRTVNQTGRRALEATDISGDPVHLPEGVPDVGALHRLSPERPVLLRSDQVEGWSASDGPAARLRDDEGRTVPVVVADTSITEGGPAPGPTDTTLQVRQRLLAEAAVLSVGSEAGNGLVFLPDDDWDPGPGSLGATLFDGLDTEWVFDTSLSTLGSSGEVTRVRPAEDELAPPPLPSYVLDAALTLRRRATTMQAISGPDSDLLAYYQQVVALSVSATRRDDPEEAEATASAMTATIDDQLGRITVEGPEYVTLSSDSGRFPVTLTNRLDQPVTVGAVLYDEEGLLSIDDIEPQVLAPRTQVTLTLTVRAPDVGVSTVSAQLVTEQGRAFGEPIRFPLRSSMVGEIIWYAMGAIGVFLLLLVGRRIGRRLRGGSPASSAPDTGTDAGTGTGAGTAPGTGP
jgi:hypothetical protein